MRLKRLESLFFFLIIMTISSIAYGEVKIEKNGYVISLPDEWIEIPSEVLEKYEKMVSVLAPNAKKQHYDCGFQLSGKENWLDYPYVIIQVKNTGRITESELAKIQDFSMQKTLDEEGKNFSAVMSNIQAGDMIYDKENKIIWMRVEADVKEIGPISGISGMILTEKGLIQVNAYSLKEDYATYEPVFRSIVKSVTPSPELAYKSKWFDSLPVSLTGINWGKVGSKAVGGAIIAGIIALIIGIIRRKIN